MQLTCLLFITEVSFLLIPFIPKTHRLPQGCRWEFQSQMQTLHSYCFCFNKTLFKPAKTSIGVYIHLLSKESET